MRIEPPLPDAAVTREGDQICISGLPLAAVTHLVLRAGMPGEDGVDLRKDTPVAIAMGNRAPRLAFDNRLFLLPRGQAPRISLTSVNLSAVKIRLVRVSERAMLPWTKDNQLGTGLESYLGSQIAGHRQDGVGRPRRDPEIRDERARRTPRCRCPTPSRSPGSTR